VSYHESCSPAKKNETGHFEMIENVADYYYFTAKNKPVGITGAKVIT